MTLGFRRRRTAWAPRHSEICGLRLATVGRQEPRDGRHGDVSQRLPRAAARARVLRRLAPQRASAACRRCVLLACPDALLSRTQAPKKRAKERAAASRKALRSPHCCVLGPSARGITSSPAKAWVCADGCCSIRWKLDYDGMRRQAPAHHSMLGRLVDDTLLIAGFLSCKAYADVSPYVVTVDETHRCRCVICRGLPSGLVNRRAEPTWSRVDRSWSREASKGDRADVALGKAGDRLSLSSGASLTDDEDLLL